MMAGQTEESKETLLRKSAERLTEEIQSMTNYKNLYSEIQVSAKRLLTAPLTREDSNN